MTKNESDFLFNDIALSNIMYIEEKYRCKIIVDIYAREIRCICTKVIRKKINEEIKNKKHPGDISEHTF